jgi:hypothetical protein
MLLQEERDREEGPDADISICAARRSVGWATRGASGLCAQLVPNCASVNAGSPAVAGALIAE